MTSWHNCRERQYHQQIRWAWGWVGSCGAAGGICVGSCSLLIPQCEHRGDLQGKQIDGNSLPERQRSFFLAVYIERVDNMTLIAL